MNLQTEHGAYQNRTTQTTTLDGLPPANPEWRLKQELAINPPEPPQPFGTYVEAVQASNLLFLTGTLPTEGRSPKCVGRVSEELVVETPREAARLATLNSLAVAKAYLGSLDRVARIVRLGVPVATASEGRELAKVADGASELLQDVFGRHRIPSRLVSGVASLPFGTPVALEMIFEVAE